MVDVARLRLGMYVYLDLGWMEHPFALNNFRISSQDQINTIRGLGLQQVRYAPEQSDAKVAQELAIEDGEMPAPVVVEAAPAQGAETPEASRRRLLRAALAEQNRSLAQAERHFAQATRAFRQSVEKVRSEPQAARQITQELVQSFLKEALGNHESCIRLLSEGSGDRASLHSINVTVISLMLARVLKFSDADLADIGEGALLHDIGKIELPDRVRWRADHFTSAETQFYQDHVAQGLNLGRKMELSSGTLLVLAQHHELMDGSGFPRKLTGDKLSPLARVVALVNRYEDLCNPNNPSQALTPHESLSLMFAQQKSKYDSAYLQAFIRMMGVYPPGSVIQLNDGRYALVVSVNSSRPLKPRVLIHDPTVPRDDALVIDLESEPSLGIRRSLKPLQLPASTMNYLSPRSRLCYYFERARDPLMELNQPGGVE